jgi:NDP-sugar pyrophosphorylase family protein
MLNIVLPIAGRGSRFANVGYTLPKPLIEIHGMPMIEFVVNNIKPKCDHKFIFVALEEHLNFLGMRETLNRIAPGCIIVPVNTVTEGAACTVLLAKEYIDNSDQLMIANSDQWVDIDINNYLHILNDNSVDGLIMTMTDNDPKWSYIGISKDNLVETVVEKQVISNEATVGIYNFKKGLDFVNSAETMIKNELKVNGEYYVAPVYNFLISENSKIKYFNIGKVGDGMYGLGIPEDLKIFCDSSKSLKYGKI